MKTLFRTALCIPLFLFSESIVSQTSYSPDMSLRNTIRKTVWEQLKSKTPKKQQFLLGLVFNSNEPFTQYEKAARQRSWSPYEIHTAASFFKIVGEEVVRGKDYTEAEIKSIYNEVRSRFDTKKIDAKLDDRSKQQKYDALILKAFWAASMFELAKKNSPETQELARQMLNENPIFDSSTSVAKNSGQSSKKTSSTTQKNTTSNPVPVQSKNNTGDIVDVIMRTVTSYGLGGVYVNNEVNVLYKNGDVFTNPTEPLESFDMAKSKRTKPKKWDRWKKQGNIIYVTRSKTGKTYDWKKYFPVRQAPRGFKISGKFNTSDPFGGSAVINASTVVFDNQGRFAWKTIKGGDTDWKPIYSKSSSAGTYQINKYTITLDYNNGTTESFFFGLYPKDNQHFIIGSSHFVPVEK